MIDLHEYFAVMKFLQKGELPHLSKLTSFSAAKPPAGPVQVTPILEVKGALYEVKGKVPTVTNSFRDSANGYQGERDKPLVGKTHFDSDFKLVYVAGIEGVGHHAVCGWLEKFTFEDDRGLGERFARSLAKYWFTPFISEHVAKYNEMKLYLNELKGEAARTANPYGNSHIISPCSYTTGRIESGGGPGMLSYPNGVDSDWHENVTPDMPKTLRKRDKKKRFERI